MEWRTSQSEGRPVSLCKSISPSMSCKAYNLLTMTQEPIRSSGIDAQTSSVARKQCVNCQHEGELNALEDPATRLNGPCAVSRRNAQFMLAILTMNHSRAQHKFFHFYQLCSPSFNYQANYLTLQLTIAFQSPSIENFRNCVCPSLPIPTPYEVDNPSKHVCYGISSP